MTSPMPMNATPMVAMVVHELPVSTEMAALTMQASIRNREGERMSSP